VPPELLLALEPLDEPPLLELPLLELPDEPPEDDEPPPLLLPEPPSAWVVCESPELSASESGATLDSESHGVLLSKASSTESARELSNEGPTSPAPTSG
jgi:hypothetical protein